MNEALLAMYDRHRRIILAQLRGRVEAQDMEDVRFTYENKTNDVIQKNIGGCDVTIVHAGSSYRCYWNQDDHVFALTTTGLPLDEVEKIVENVERIR